LVPSFYSLLQALALTPKLFDSLSDGEKQRVMIARSLAQSSQLMVLDEITAFLDLPGRVEIMALLRRHAKEANNVVILSSHDLDLSLELADTLWIIHKGQLFGGPPNSLIEDGVIGDAFDCISRLWRDYAWPWY